MRPTAGGPLLTSVDHDVDGSRWHVQTGGPSEDQHNGDDVPTVVLVHGVGLAGAYMMPTARRLAPHCRIFVPDLPGYGKSDPPRGTPDAAGNADLLLRWMDAIGLDRATFLGNSFGCNIAVELAIKGPKRVASLVLQGPTIDPQGRRWWRALLRGARDPRLIRLVPIGSYQYPRAGFHRIFETYRAVFDHRLEDRLPYVTAPTLVIHGARDPITPVSWGEEIVRLLPRGELRVIPGTTHAAVYFAPLEVARISLPFIRRHHDRARRTQRTVSFGHPPRSGRTTPTGISRVPRIRDVQAAASDPTC